MKTNLYRWAKAKGAAALPGRAPALAELMERLTEHLHLPLFRNGYALLFSGATTSALGLLYWALAARLYPAATVGVGSALLSAMLLLSGVAQLSLNNVLVRFIPAAGHDTRALIIKSYAASSLMALVLSLVFVAGISWWSPALQFLQSQPLWLAAFGLATMIWCVFALQDSALTGLRQAVWVPLENTLFSIVKIVLLVALAGSVGPSGIFASWTAPVALSLLPVNWLIFRRFATARAAAGPRAASRIAPGEILRYVGGNYLGTVFFLIYTNLLPILVANRAGATANAYFYLPWMIAGGLQLIAINMTTSMTVEAVLSRDQLHVLSRRVLKHSLRLLLPLTAVIVIGAPWLLQLFGKTYSLEGAALMRWLALASPPNVLVVLAISIARVTNRSRWVVAINAAVCVITLALATLLLPQFGIVAVGWAWLASQVSVALVLAVTILKPTLQGSARAQPAALPRLEPAQQDERRQN